MKSERRKDYIYEHFIVDKYMYADYICDDLSLTFSCVEISTPLCVHIIRNNFPILGTYNCHFSP
jgi:hypothetical protein